MGRYACPVATVHAERVRRFTAGELARMRARGVIPADDPVELHDGRLVVDGRPRPIQPDEAIAMVETGILAPDERVELIEGELLLVSAQGKDHRWVVVELNEIMASAYRGAAKVVVQSSAYIPGSSLPEPDLMVVRRNPTGGELDDVILAIEVAVTSQAYDRRKARIYAEAGVRELWRLDVPARTVAVQLDPRPDGTWGSVRQAGEDEPLVLPEVGVTLTLRQVLPPA